MEMHRLYIFFDKIPREDKYLYYSPVCVYNYELTLIEGWYDVDDGFTGILKKMVSTLYENA